MTFSVGTLVKARGREWVVLPESQEQFVIVRPLGGTDAEVAGIDTELETVEPASFALPDPTRLGDFQSCRMLRDAIRLGFRSSAGPFRSFGKIAVEPRPYQLGPLLMALKLDPVELRLRSYSDVDQNTGQPYSSKALRECYRQGAAAFGWDKRNPEPRSMRDGRELVGWGMATGIWEALQMPITVRIALSANGHAEVSCATSAAEGSADAGWGSIANAAAPPAPATNKRRLIMVFIVNPLQESVPNPPATRIRHRP